MAHDTKFAFIAETNICDLRAKQTYELIELLERQDHLLKNRSLINKLKDKGEKIQKFRDEISKELESRKQHDDINPTNLAEININSCEWKTKPIKQEQENVIQNEENPLQILAENGQIPHVKRLIDKEKDTGFSFKPYNATVSEKIRDIVPTHAKHSATTSEHTAKKIHLDESLHLLTEQLSALKVLCNANRSKRANECLKDILNESNEEEQENEEITDDFESKPGPSIVINK